MPSRRQLLGGLGASVAALSAGGLVRPRVALASDLALSDRIDLLYSNQFNFNERGEPQITVGLMQGQSKVRISAPGGLRVLPSGDGGTAIEGGERFEIFLTSGRPSKQEYRVVLQALAGPAMRAVGRAAKRWKSLGLDSTDQEVGTVFGVAGHVLDNRRVLLLSGKFSSEKAALVEAKTLKKKHGALGKLHPIVSRRSEGSIVAKDLDKDVKIRAEGVLWFAPRGRGPITVHDVLSGTTMGPGRRGDRQYWGSIYVAVDRHGKLTVVNLVSESELLAGLVPAEIFASAPMEALKAQAVAARGQLVSKVGSRHLDDPFLLCAEQHCQVYAGRGREHPRTTKAVNLTVGRVAMRPGGTQLVDTVYSANSGGHTEHNDVVWPSQADPQLRGRPDPLVPEAFRKGINDENLAQWLRSNPISYSRPDGGVGKAAYRWTHALDPSAIPGAPERVGTVKALEVRNRGRSGRATTLKIVGEHGLAEIHGELRIRRALGGLKSSMFLIEKNRDKFGRFILVGGGHGHGVGLCQHGAMGMARGKKRYAEILAHYYSGSKLLKLWSAS